MGKSQFNFPTFHLAAPKPSPKPAAKPKPARPGFRAGDIIRVTAAELIVRKDPEPGSARLTALKGGRRARVYGVEGSWLKVLVISQGKRGHGWIDGSKVVLLSRPAQWPPKSAPK